MKKLLLHQFTILAAIILFLQSCTKDIVDYGKTLNHDNSTTLLTPSENLRSPSDNSALRSSSENMAMGNPSGAVADPAYYWNYLMDLRKKLPFN